MIGPCAHFLRGNARMGRPKIGEPLAQCKTQISKCLCISNSITGESRSILHKRKKSFRFFLLSLPCVFLQKCDNADQCLSCFRCFALIIVILPRLIMEIDDLAHLLEIADGKTCKEEHDGCIIFECCVHLRSCPVPLALENRSHRAHDSAIIMFDFLQPAMTVIVTGME